MSKVPDPAKMEPIANRVVVRRDKPAEATKSGITLPDIAQEHPLFGTVLAVGPGALRAIPENGCSRHPMQCKVGDRVLLPPNQFDIFLDANGTPSERKASGVVIVAEEQLLAIFRE